MPCGRESVFTECKGKDKRLVWCQKFIGCGNKRTKQGVNMNIAK